MADILAFDGFTTLPLDPDLVITRAAGGFPGGVMMIGYDTDGRLDIRSSIAGDGDMLLLLEMARATIIRECMD